MIIRNISNPGVGFAPTGALAVGACSLADEVPPAAKAPGPLGTGPFDNRDLYSRGEAHLTTPR